MDTKSTLFAPINYDHYSKLIVASRDQPRYLATH